MIFNMIISGGSGSGGTLVVTAPAGVTVIANNETLGKEYKRTANLDGVATFEGLDSGIWGLHITDGERTSAPVAIEIVSDYKATLDFFAAYINVTYPINSTCTCTSSDGTVIFEDINNGIEAKTVTITVPHDGKWILSVADSKQTDTKEVEITDKNQIETITFAYSFRAYIDVTYPANSTCTCTSSNGSTVFTDTNETDTEKVVTFTVPEADTWIVSCFVGDDSTARSNAEVEIKKENEGQSFERILTDELVLFNSGKVHNLASSFVGNADKGSGSYSDASYIVDKASLKVATTSGHNGTAWSIISSENGIDISDFSLIQFNIDSTYEDTNGDSTLMRKVGLAKTSLNSSLEKSVDVTKTGLVEFNISDMDGIYYPTIYGYASSSGEAGYIGGVELSVNKIVLLP